MLKTLTIKLIGSMGYSPWPSKLAKKFTSCQLLFNGKRIQVDVGNKWQGPRADFVLITHTHYDHVQEFKTVPKNTEVLLPSGTFIDKLRRKNPFVNFRIIKQKTSLDGLSVRPFPILHSSTSLTYGLKFFYDNKTIVWLPDYMIIPTLSEILSDVDFLFLGASALKKDIIHKGYGHGQKSVYKMLQRITRLPKPPKLIYLIHFGMGMRPILVKGHYLQKEFKDLDIRLTQDGKIIRIE